MQESSVRPVQVGGRGVCLVVCQWCRGIRGGRSKTRVHTATAQPLRRAAGRVHPQSLQSVRWMRSHLFSTLRRLPMSEQTLEFYKSSLWPQTAPWAPPGALPAPPRHPTVPLPRSSLNPPGHIAPPLISASLPLCISLSLRLSLSLWGLCTCSFLCLQLLSSPAPGSLPPLSSPSPNFPVSLVPFLSTDLKGNAGTPSPPPFIALQTSVFPVVRFLGFVSFVALPVF